MIAFTNEARMAIIREAKETIISLNRLSDLIPISDSKSLEEIIRAIECLKRLVSECDNEITADN